MWHINVISECEFNATNFEFRPSRMANLTQLMRRLTELMTLLQISPAKTELMAAKAIKHVITLVILG